MNRNLKNGCLSKGRILKGFFVSKYIFAVISQENVTALSSIILKLNFLYFRKVKEIRTQPGRTDLGIDPLNSCQMLHSLTGSFRTRYTHEFLLNLS